MIRTLSVVLLVVFAIASLTGCKTANPQPRADLSHGSIQLVEGDYLSSGYIEGLAKTRSPLETGGRVGGIHLLQVRRRGAQFVLGPIINFHEGDSVIVLNPDGSVLPSSEADEGEYLNLSATVLDDHTIRFGYDDYKAANFVFVKDAEAYVAKAVLVGKYKDNHGRRYEFREDGWAEFPDRKFKFEIGLDHVEVAFDYFMDTTHARPWRLWAFKWNRDTLEIFRTKEPDGGLDEIIDSRPFLSLHPVR